MNKIIKKFHCRIKYATVLLGTIVIVQGCIAQKKTASSGPVSFKKHTISFLNTSEEYISEGVAVADVNKDGKTDLLSGTFWWQAPDWERHEITVPEIHSIGGYGNHFLDFPMDVNQDGWTDLIGIGLPSKEAYWYENPKNKPGHWKRHLVYPSVGNESPCLVDVDGDGRLDLLCNDPTNRKVIWISAPKAKNDTSWTTHVISNDTLRGTDLFTHGLGFGDMNGDGRKDVIYREGWWEAPVDRTKTDWTFHSADLGEECSQMYPIDVDTDGDIDIVSASAHNYGIWWYEQVREGTDVSWKKHEIFKEFSQSHGMAMVDINRDGNPDLVTGKRFWAHNGNDPGEREPAVIYWFEFKPGKSPQWIPHLIDDNSGIGLHIVAQDINNDKLVDIIIGNKKGVFFFEQVKPAKN